MADSDFLSYSSIYDSFSKGPKSVYYGIGDEMLPGAILNTPQTDDDDEWGRTQRIGDERSYDFIAKIYKTLFDPYNSIPSVSLVPGEAGSEINVAKNMIRLIGRSGIDAGVFDLTVPSMTLSGIILNGSDNKITIGETFEINEDSISINTDFIIASDSTQGTITYKTVSSSFYSYSGVSKYTINVNTKEYLFGESSGTPIFQLPVDGILNVRGNLTTNDIQPNAQTFNIGTSTCSYNYIYASNFVGDILTNSIYPPVEEETLTIGRASCLDKVRINITYFDIYHNNYPTDSLFSINDEDGIQIGNYGCNYYVTIYTSSFSVYSNSSSSESFSVTDYNINFNRDVVPGSGVSLGDSSNIFTNIYANKIYSTQGMFGVDVPLDSTWYINGPNLDIFVNNIRKFSVCSSVIEAEATMYTRSVYPSEAEGFQLGTVGLAYEALYLKDQVTGVSRKIYICAGALLIS